MFYINYQTPLPKNIVLNVATGELHGKPVLEGMFVIKIRAYNTLDYYNEIAITLRLYSKQNINIEPMCSAIIESGIEFPSTQEKGVAELACDHNAKGSIIKRCGEGENPIWEDSISTCGKELS